jgi:hypothetical protein
MKLKYIIIAALLFQVACNPAETKTAETNTSAQAETPKLPTFFEEVLQAHGGLDNWNQLGTMEYQLTNSGNTETHIIDLKNRKDLVKGTNYSIGFDGAQVWVSPDKAAYPGKSARFYHNLFFYFYAIPFVLADPGVSYQQLDDITIQDKSYKVIEVAFGDGIGDTPEDKYRMLINPETKRMEWLLYTVTYFDGKPSDKFNALKYEDYQEVNGLLFPKTLTGYKYENGQIGDARYSVTLDKLQLKKEQPDQKQFEMPEKAEVDSLVTPAI